MATLSFSNIGTTSLTAKVSGLDTNFAYNRRFEWFAGNIGKGTSYTSPGASSVSKTISGLSSGTRYAIIVDIYNDDLNTYLTTLYEYVTTDAPDIEPWEWWTSKTGLDLRPSPDEWLAFCNKINEIRIANGLSAYTFTTSSTYIGKDKPFYAWMWLQAANAINEISGQVASDCLTVKSQRVSMGNDSIIYPWYFENLKTALNNAISS